MRLTYHMPGLSPHSSHIHAPASATAPVSATPNQASCMGVTRLGGTASNVAVAGDRRSNRSDEPDLERARALVGAATLVKLPPSLDPARFLLNRIIGNTAIVRANTLTSNACRHASGTAGEHTRRLQTGSSSHTPTVEKPHTTD